MARPPQEKFSVFALSYRQSCRFATLLLQRPTVSTVIIGARNEQQLQENLGAVGWTLSVEHLKVLDEASKTTPAYPYWRQRGFGERNPGPVG